ncbi:MAG: PadR family transcriptional regulator [Caldisphaeraceae archaeon]|nr:PadR family transcriptional regulator [Caldisphaeraceae archaeon]
MIEREKIGKPLSRLIKNITIHTLWIYVLAILARESTYPYQIKKKIKEIFLFNPPTVTLYTVIYRLEREGLIAKGDTGSYRITDKGREALKTASNILRELSDKLNHLE